MTIGILIKALQQIPPVNCRTEYTAVPPVLPESHLLEHHCSHPFNAGQASCLLVTVGLATAEVFFRMDQHCFSPDTALFAWRSSFPSSSSSLKIWSQSYISLKIIASINFIFFIYFQFYIGFIWYFFYFFHIFANYFIALITFILFFKKKVEFPLKTPLTICFLPYFFQQFQSDTLLICRFQQSQWIFQVFQEACQPFQSAMLQNLLSAR